MEEHDRCDADAILARARRVLQIEADAILHVQRQLGEPFVALARLILETSGKVVISGVGKSGIVGAKMAATLSSTGTPAIPLDPLCALHGDLGVLAQRDVLIAISHSGETDELLNVVTSAREIGARIVALTGNAQSTLARASDLVVPVAIEQEACPLGLAPTASTATVMAVGDALAMALLEQRRFTRQDFATFHPGGSLGRRLKLRVRDLMRKGDSLPSVPLAARLADAVREMSERDNVGVTFVVHSAGELAGIVTDGDLRRALQRSLPGTDLKNAPIEQMMTRRPKVVDADALASEALRIMELHSITSLGIVDGENRPVGIILLHDILGRGKLTI